MECRLGRGVFTATDEPSRAFRAEKYENTHDSGHRHEDDEGHLITQTIEPEFSEPSDNRGNEDPDDDDQRVHTKPNAAHIGGESLDDIHLRGGDENTVRDTEDDSTDVERAKRGRAHHDRGRRHTSETGHLHAVFTTELHGQSTLEN
jgi:hypothetical protein